MGHLWNMIDDEFGLFICNREHLRVPIEQPCIFQIFEEEWGRQKKSGYADLNTLLNLQGHVPDCAPAHTKGDRMARDTTVDQG